jgi:Putative peptidoglycan binding domain
MKRDAYLALKKLAFQLGSACVSLGVVLSLAAAPSPTSPQKKTTRTTTAQKARIRAAKQGRNSPALGAARSRSSETRKLVAVHQVTTRAATVQEASVPPKSAKGRQLKARARTHAATPSIQNHPDPERYQQIQQALTDRGYFKGDVNGKWDQDSTDALTRFQTDKKLDADGKISARTLNGLGLGPRHDGSTAPLSGPLAARETGGDTPSLNAPVPAPPPAEAPQ